MYLDVTECKQRADYVNCSSKTNNLLGGRKKTNKKRLISEERNILTK